MRALIIAHGESPSPELLRELAREAELVVAADGGVVHALAAGVEVDAVVGDLDSFTAAQREAVEDGRVQHIVDVNTTDLQKAIGYCVTHGATSVAITGAGGGRADHALANLSVLTLYRDVVPLRIVDDRFEVTLVDGEAVLTAPEGTVISLVALGLARGVTTSGLRWNLQEYDLPFSPYGVHNEVAGNPVTVRVRSGDLLLFRGRWVEKHV